jgi:hypothetical protein
MAVGSALVTVSTMVLTPGPMARMASFGPPLPLMPMVPW